MGYDAQIFVELERKCSTEAVVRASDRLRRDLTQNAFVCDPLVIAPEWELTEYCSHELQEKGHQGRVLMTILGSRYYDVDYEYGDLPMIIAIAEAIEEEFSGCVIWYGATESPFGFRPWPAEKRAALMDHFHRESRTISDLPEAEAAESRRLSEMLASQIERAGSG